MENCTTFIGIDAHKKYCYVNVQNKDGDVVESLKVDTNRESLDSYFSKFRNTNSSAVLESTYNWMFVYNMIKDHVKELKLANPKQTKAISAAKVKTDKVDAKTLANLLRANLIPEVYVSTQEQRDYKDIIRYRYTLLHIRTGLKNRIHAFMARCGFENPFSDLFGRMGRAYLVKLPWVDPIKTIVDRYLALIDELTNRIKEIDKNVNAQLRITDDMKLLVSIPGIGALTAYLIMCEIGTIYRFSDMKKLVSYSGLVPGIDSSAGTTRYKKSKDRNKYLQWAFIEAAIPAIQNSPILLGKYNRIKRRTNNNKKAKMTVARKLAEAAYKVLTKREPYKEGITIKKSAPSGS